ncbi:hypothetical protein MY04_5478 [Flammeovirga sp. MY04]|uniref:glycoside hydrolase family 99-like domain-containing protein n=1 Tax=Flammeovirga sp. MY04 TaxID=1191459 RepID=UPI000806362B|nr:glycoside hydrolase family 99-like domain-containing protein [Flammeovirga sp. MY04]ANQ52809.1 hypothetical protein MY04_5478 [Flammeovirga sp. MY04]
MKSKIYLLLISVLCIFSSCTEEEVNKEGHLIDYEIEEVPVEQDYMVGAFYAINTLPWNANIEEVPVLGEYGVADETAMKAHIDWASDLGGIDYFLFRFTNASNADDKNMLNAFMAQNTENKMKFALRYNFGNLGINEKNTLEDKGLVDVFINEFKEMIPYFNEENYLKVDDKYVVNVINAHRFFCNDIQAVYQQLRDEMSAEGYELYIIGEQSGWVPPARFEMFFEGVMDGIAPTTMFNNSNYDRHITFPQILDQHWLYSKDYYLNKFNIEWVPTIAPAFNPKIQNPTSAAFKHDRTETYWWSMLNVAKKSTGAHRLIIINSFNEWKQDTQLEPSETYGTSSLELLKQQTKR